MQNTAPVSDALRRRKHSRKVSGPSGRKYAVMCHRASAAKLIAATFAALIAVNLAAAASGSTSGVKTEKLYRWVDDKGVVHYGDSVPPEYSKQKRDVLNKQGVQIGTMDAEKSPAQVAEELRQREALRQAQARDEILLRTYISAEQIEQLRDQRLELIEGQIKVTTQYLQSRRTKLVQLHVQSGSFRPYSTAANARPMPDQLAEDLVRTLNDIRIQEDNLKSKRAEQQSLRAQFHSDIERFKELKTAQAVTRTQ